jgi:hypothetical protein
LILKARSIAATVPLLEATMAGFGRYATRRDKPAPRLQAASQAEFSDQEQIKHAARLLAQGTTESQDGVLISANNRATIDGTDES